MSKPENLEKIRDKLLNDNWYKSTEEILAYNNGVLDSYIETKKLEEELCLITK